MRLDELGLAAALIAMFAAAVCIPMSWRDPAAAPPDVDPRHGDFQALLLASVLGMTLLAQAQNLIAFFVALELLSVPLGPVLGIPQDVFPAEVPRYNPVSLDNWRPEAAIIMGAAAAGAVAGQAAVLFSDLLRDRILLRRPRRCWGSFDLTQFLALYENRSGGTALGAAARSTSSSSRSTW